MRMDKHLLELGFTRSECDHDLYILNRGEKNLVLILYVDDLLLVSDCKDLVAEIKAKLASEFSMRDLGAVSYYLGMHIDRDPAHKTLHLHQHKYLEDVVARFGMSKSKAAPKPMEVGFHPLATSEETPMDPEKTKRFHSIVGSCMYGAVSTRPDLSFTVGLLGRVVSNPMVEHEHALRRLLRYVRGTSHLGLHYEAVPISLIGFTDSDWAGDPSTRQSTSGLVFALLGGAVAWQSKRQNLIAVSSTEVEYVALNRGGIEAVWLRRLLAELGYKQEGPTLIHVDNQAAINLAKKPLGAFLTMAGSEERGGRGAGGSVEAQAQGQTRDSAMAPMQPSLGPPRDELRVFGLDKFNGDNFAKWSFRMENVFDHYDLLEVMEGMEKRPANDPKKSLWVQKSAQGYLLLGQALGSSQIRHIKPFQHELEKGPNAWAALKGVHAPATAAVAVVLERQMAALRIEEDEAVEEGVQKFFNLLTRLEGADLNYSELQKKTKLLALLLDSWSSLIINLNHDLPRLSLEEQASAEGMAVEGAEDEGEADLVATTSMEAAGVADTAVTIRATDAVAADSTASATIVTRADICGAIATSSLMDGLLLKAKRVEEQKEGEEEAVEAVAVAEVVLQRAEVKGMGKAMFKGADGKIVGLKNVLWVPNLAANLISVRRLQKAGMDTSSKGAKTYTARLGEQIHWDLHEDMDVYNEMWQIPVVPMPKERQVAASISTKGEAVRSGDGVNGHAKEIKSKMCNLGGTSKLGEHEESGAAAQKQHKGEENPKAAAEEDYGESMWGTIASASFSNLTSATGECDWLTLHRCMGHVALPILQQLVKNEMVAGIYVKGEPDEVLGCPTCMQAKFTRYPLSSSETTAKAPLDEVVMDVVGPLKLGAARAEYFLIIKDVYTRMT
ncbi:unnamed protein product [Closterium sp. NIES-54]